MARSGGTIGQERLVLAEGSPVSTVTDLEAFVARAHRLARRIEGQPGESG
jgi:hypothetical protein